VRQLVEVLKYLDSHLEEQLERQEMPRSAVAVLDHSRAHLKAELDWTKDLLEKVERGEYP
jgi:hypothetical protein